MFSRRTFPAELSKLSLGQFGNFKSTIALWFYIFQVCKHQQRIVIFNINGLDLLYFFIGKFTFVMQDLFITLTLRYLNVLYIPVCCILPSWFAIACFLVVKLALSNTWQFYLSSRQSVNLSRQTSICPFEELFRLM